MQETKKAGGQTHQLTEKPTYIIPEKPLQVNLDNIPSDMKERSQWVLMNIELVKDKETGKEDVRKVPYQPDGKRAKSNDKRTWNNFDNVVNAFRTGKFHTVGFMLSLDDEYTFIDFDDCIDESGMIHDKHSKWINDINSYTEYSQSGEGIHIIVRGSLRSLIPEKNTKSLWATKGEWKSTGRKNTKLDVEVYDHKRAITFTGNRFPHTPTEPQERQEQLNSWFHEVFPPNQNNVLDFPKGTNTSTYSNEQIISLCTKKHKEKFTNLYYAGDTSNHNDDDSSADLALCNYFCVFTDSVEQIEELFESSALYRDKWNREDYRIRTISKAIESAAQYKLNKAKQDFETQDDPQYHEWLKLMEQSSYDLNNGKLVIWKEVKNKKTHEWNWEQIPLCNFVARIDKEITEDDGIETTKKIELVGMREGAIPLSTIQVPIKDFESLSWVVEKWGTLCNMEPEPNVKNKVRYAIQEFSKQQQQEYIYTHLGWRKIAGKWNYLHAGGSIGTSGVKVNVEQNNLSNYLLPESVLDLPKAIKASLELKDVAEPHISLSLLSMVGLAPLCEPFRQVKQEPAFILWLVGLSGSRKSTIAGCVLNHFGDFGNKSLPATFKDTMNALEKKAYLVKDSLLVVDDFHPTEYERKSMEQKAGSLLRGYGDRVGKERMKQDMGTRKSFAPQGLCLVTGEDIPNGSRSDFARLFPIPVDKETGVNNQVLDKFQTVEHRLKLRESYRGYIEWLLPQIDELSTTLSEMFLNLRKAIQEQVVSGQHGRLNETIVWLLIGLQFYTKYALDHQAITPDERKELLTLAKKEFMELGSKHTNTIQEEKKSNMFCVALRELVATKQVCVQSKDGLSSLGGEFHSDRIGYYDENHLYLFPETTKGIVEQFYKKQGRTFSISLKMLYRELINENLLVAGTDGQPTKQVKVEGKNQRFLVIEKTIIGDNDDDSFLDPNFK